MGMLKPAFGIVAVFLAATAYGSYIYKVFKHEVRPHFFTWLVWAVVTIIICVAQILKGAGAGSWVIIFTSACCLGIAFLALIKGDRNYTRGDWIALSIALGTIPLWLITHDPFYSVAVLTLIDAVGFIPTFRKAYQKPREESWVSFALVVFQNIFLLFALSSYNSVTLTYPLAVLIMDSSFVIMLLWRRRNDLSPR